MHFDFNPAHPTLWVFFALLIILAAAWKFGAHKAIGGALDRRANAIKSELDEARRLREEAQALLASFQRRQAEAEQQAEEIVAQARADAKTMAQQAREDLQTRLARRAELANAKIAAAESDALAEVRGRAADLAMAATQQLIASELKTGGHSKLVADGISELGAALS